MSRRRAGFTLLEMLIATGLLGLVIGSSLMVALQGGQAFKASSVMVASNDKARHALTRIVEELQRAGGTLTPDLTASGGSDTVTFTAITGTLNGNAVWSNPLRIARVPASNDPDDGVDNDNDGLVDEGQIVLTREVGLPGQISIVLCTNVRERAENEVFNGIDDNGNGLIDEGGFSLQRVSDLLTIRITVEEPGEGGRTALSTVSASFNLRN